MVPWAHTSLTSKRRLDRFSRFFSQLTSVPPPHTPLHTHSADTQTTLRATSTSNRPHLCTACWRCERVMTHVVQDSQAICKPFHMCLAYSTVTCAAFEFNRLKPPRGFSVTAEPLVVNRYSSTWKKPALTRVQRPTSALFSCFRTLTFDRLMQK